MKQSWLRRNWLWAAGGAFLGLHLATWILQKSMKHSVHSELQLKQKSESEEKL
uniref:Uncharacterized protein n=1 Tax=Astyanax mexicanus TaxID=7994 RepID=A0A8B9HDH0_ASTMX